ncbi:Metallo-dependent phosphatase [Aspergillus avenaceus]|uniref:Metallo-dependent phosphatase n=1 Tax=Aspergillus avenaceus TaxID=36643 RepID=A0A5N6TES5_ASPAV|nr:Metallo-dependent phosphatase [Aspergillus avenaceus]
MPQSTPNRGQDTHDYTLRFSKDGTFQITMFTDLHFAEDEDTADGPAKDARSIEVMENVLGYDTQQLVVLNGDQISGYGTKADNTTAYVDQIVGPMVERDLPWASTYGNHDHQSFADTLKTFQQETTYSQCLTQRMIPGEPDDLGVSNYFLPVYPAVGSQVDSEATPELILWFFDSRGGNYQNDGRERPDWVHSEVVEWFKEKNINLTTQYGKTIPSIAFFHIPLSAAKFFREDPGVNPSREPGQNGEVVSNQGEMYDHKTGHDIELMWALAKADGLLATFSGHDHTNDWCFKWTEDLPGQDVPGSGVNVCYGRHSGYGGYGDLDRGARHIVLNKDTLQKELVTWIRLEDGRIGENVTLNATYGKDEYHPGPVHLELKRDQFENTGLALAPSILSTVLCLFMIFYLPLRLWN